MAVAGSSGPSGKQEIPNEVFLLFFFRVRAGFLRFYPVSTGICAPKLLYESFKGFGMGVFVSFSHRFLSVLYNSGTHVPVLHSPSHHSMYMAKNEKTKAFSYVQIYALRPIQDPDLLIVTKNRTSRDGQ
jgi:hypothetical protein